MKKTDDEKAGAALRDKGREWIKRIETATAHEKDWLDDAHKAERAYTNEAKSEAGDLSGNLYDYNILFANVETIVPAVINSPPAPDIRRRFGDADDAARTLAELYERVIRIQIDDSRLQLEMEGAAQDGFLAGRGILRLRYESNVINPEAERDELDDAAEGETEAQEHVTGEPGEDEAPEPVEGFEQEAQPERLENERITFEAVSWRDFRHGPAKRWADVPWVAFRFVVPKECEEDEFDSALIASQSTKREQSESTGADDEIIGWEIWDKKSKQVYFVRDNGTMLKQLPDPLGLASYFPMATPLQPIEVNGRLKPVNPFSIYRQLADELDDITKRINKLINQMKIKGWYYGAANDLQKVLDLSDNEFAPITDAEIFAQAGGIDKAIAFWPIERFIQVLRELYTARNEVKAAIYEITGISDIIRGASAASETATAQNIKSQWGSLRIQKMQRMMERAARDLFVLMSEIIPTKFSIQTLEQISGIPLMPSPQDDPETMQKKMGVLSLMKQRAASFYRIDVESDSTVRADLTRQKQEVAEFLQGAAAYFGAVAPLVQQGALPADAAVDIFASTARMFNLGKSVEDTLEKMAVDAKAQAEQMRNNPPPDPAEQQAQAEQQAKAHEMEVKGMQAQIDMQKAQQEFAAKQAEIAAKTQQLQAQMEATGQKAAIEEAIKEMERQIKSIDLQIKQTDLAIKRADLASKDVIAEDGEDGQMVVKSRTDEGFKALGDHMAASRQDLQSIVQVLGQAIAQQGDRHEQGLASIHKAMTAPTIMRKDPTTGEKVAIKVIN